MILRCLVDGLLLPAELVPGKPSLLARDGEECFLLEAVEALFYEVTAASCDEIIQLQREGYRLLRLAEDAVIVQA